MLLASCGGGNQALLASGGPDDFAAMNRIANTYGSSAGEDFALNISGEEPRHYKIWTSLDGTKIMVQTADVGGVAVEGFIYGLSSGVIKREVNSGPYKDAALAYLTTKYNRSCLLSDSRRLTRVGFEWDFSCGSSASAKG
jgi:hypothetical protein